MLFLMGAFWLSWIKRFACSGGGTRSFSLEGFKTFHVSTVRAYGAIIQLHKVSYRPLVAAPIVFYNRCNQTCRRFSFSYQVFLNQHDQQRGCLHYSFILPPASGFFKLGAIVCTGYSLDWTNEVLILISWVFISSGRSLPTGTRHQHLLMSP